jgi:hypothetical protein
VFFCLVSVLVRHGSEVFRAGDKYRCFDLSLGLFVLYESLFRYHHETSFLNGIDSFLTPGEDLKFYHVVVKLKLEIFQFGHNWA